jgi:hypothetical protein
MRNRRGQDRKTTGMAGLLAGWQAEACPTKAIGFS